jgi:hypothetical protein
VSADPPARLRHAPLLVAFAFLLAAAPLAKGGDDALLLPKAEIPEDRLVDVAIDLFSPGVSDAPASPLHLKGIRSAVRKSEARYVPIHLRNTLQSTGQWGAVRVVPGGAAWAELLVTGAIEKSNGKDLRVRVVARDATGRAWVEKLYKGRADTTAYAKDRPVDGRDPFQVLYNRIANDLVRAREKRKPRELAEVREVARLRFAASMAPDPYAAYLAAGRKGRTRVERLPAADDPMIVRISAIRDRDHMFVDTLNEYYADFYARMDKPYDDWRAYSYTEQVALDSINRASLWKKIGGAVAVVAGVVMSQGDNDAGGIEDVLVLGGIAAVQSGFEDAKEAGIHKAALTELADSFEGEVTPLLVDVDGKVVQLTGSAEAQFTKWRQLLQEIAATDEPLPADINLLPTAPAEASQP